MRTSIAALALAACSPSADGYVDVEPDAARDAVAFDVAFDVAAEPAPDVAHEAAAEAAPDAPPDVCTPRPNACLGQCGGAAIDSCNALVACPLAPSECCGPESWSPCGTGLVYLSCAWRPADDHPPFPGCTVWNLLANRVTYCCPVTP